MALLPAGPRRGRRDRDQGQLEGGEQQGRDRQRHDGLLEVDLANYQPLLPEGPLLGMGIAFLPSDVFVPSTGS
jgi:hypothetical protein